MLLFLGGENYFILEFTSILKEDKNENEVVAVNTH